MDRKKLEALNWWLAAVTSGGAFVAGLVNALLQSA